MRDSELFSMLEEIEELRRRVALHMVSIERQHPQCIDELDALRNCVMRLEGLKLMLLRTHKASTH